MDHGEIGHTPKARAIRLVDESPECRSVRPTAKGPLYRIRFARVPAQTGSTAELTVDLQGLCTRNVKQ
jgi:hypothetical protein